MSPFKKLFLLIITLIICLPAFNQTSILIFKDSVILSNPLLKRTLSITEEGITTTAFINKNTGADYSVQGSDEFRVTINKTEIEGRTLFRNFSLENIAELSENNGYKSLEIKCKGKDGGWTDGISVQLEYRIYNDLPVTRKFLTIINNSNAPVTLSDLDFENLNLIPASQYLTNVYCNYGTNLMRIPYSGDYYDPALLVYNEDAHEGFILGNEAAAVLKKTDIYPSGEKITIGMKSLNDNYPFKFSLLPGNSFKSPGAFICLYNGPKWQDAFEGDFARFVKDYLDIQLFERSSYTLFYY
jgi:alpha-galactosidase